MIGELEFERFGLPYLKEGVPPDVSVEFFHNDAPCRVSAPCLPEIGVNLFNMGFDVPLTERQALTRDRAALLGNIPPRDVLANSTPEEVRVSTRRLVSSLADKSKIIVSCGGGMPPGVRSENFDALLRVVQTS